MLRVCLCWSMPSQVCWCCVRCFGLWLDWIVVIYVAVVVYSFLVLGGDILGGEVGLAISNYIFLNGMLQWGL